MIVCKICGFDNEPGAQFCGSCGGFLEWTGEQTAPEAPTGPSVPTPPPPTGTTPTGATPTVAADSPTTTYETVQEPVDANAIICPSCGLANERDRVFCRRCAAELVPIATEPMGPTTVSSRRPALPVSPAIAIAAVVAVVAVIGLGIFVAGIIGRNAGQVAASSTPSAQTIAPSTSATASATPSASISPSPSVSLPPSPTGRIAFTSSAGDSRNIVIGQADGSGIETLLDEAGDEVQPAWSPPDLTKIAYAGKNGIRIVGLDGKNGVQFTNHGTMDRKPEWSPDGKIIAFTSSRDKDFDIYLRHVGDNDLIRLTNVRGNDTDPSWSAATDRIAFVSARGGEHDIWTMKPDGKSLVQIKSKGSQEDDPAWSPDGTKIAFASDREGTFFIYVMNADGSDPHRLASGTAVEHDPTWSPDGNFIAFARVGNPGRIVIVSAETGEEVDTLGEDGASTAFPAWEPAP